MKIHIVSDRAIAEDISAQVDAPGESVPISLKKISDELVEASVLPLNEGIHTVSIHSPKCLMQTKKPCHLCSEYVHAKVIPSVNGIL